MLKNKQNFFFVYQILFQFFSQIFYVILLMKIGRLLSVDPVRKKEGINKICFRVLEDHYHLFWRSISDIYIFIFSLLKLKIICKAEYRPNSIKFGNLENRLRLMADLISWNKDDLESKFSYALIWRRGCCGTKIFKIVPFWADW